MKLGTLLLRNGTIGLSQLEAALRNQVLYGGRLGTNLVELGHIDLDQLAAALGELTGRPVATKEQLEAAPAEYLAAIGADLSHEACVVPLGFITPDRGSLAIAIGDPTDGDALDRIARAVGAPLVPFVAPEMRLAYYLERHFGRPRGARYVRAGSRHHGDVPTADQLQSDRRREQPAAGLVIPPPVTVVPRRKRQTSLPPPLDPAATQVVLPYGAACERMDTAQDRERIGDALLEFARGRCEALVIFTVRDGNALGWRAWTARPPVSRLSALALPLGGASALQAAHDTGQPYAGPPPAPGHPVEQQLWDALGANPAPVEMLVVPIAVKQRVVNLVYAHVGTGPLPGHFVTELSALAVRAQDAYTRLVRQSKG